MFKIQILEAAATDLDSEYQYSCENWGVRHSKKYYAELRRKISRLAQHPKMFRSYDSLFKGCRKFTYKSTTVFYYVDEESETVFIFAVVGNAYNITQEEISRRL